MSNSTSHSCLPYPIRNARYSLPLSFRVSAGTPTDPTTPDTEVSTDGGATFTDCTEEITTGGSNGLGYLTLTGAETNNNILLIAGKSANCLETPAILYPRVLAIVGSGTLSAGSAGGGTLGTLLAYDVTGCFIRTTGGTGGGGTGGANNQARKIVTYNTSTGAFTVTPNWETTPDATTTYDVLLPEGVTLGMLRTLNPTTAGRTLDVSTGGEAGVDWANVGSPTTTLALTGTTIATTQKVDVETIKTQSITCSAGVTVGAFVGQGTAAIGVNASGHVSRVALVDTVTLVNTLTTYTGNTVQTGDAFARIGATGSGLTSLASAANLAIVAGYLDTEIAAIKAVTDAIGATGTGLSAIPWNAAWDAEVQSEVQDAIEVNQLDHFIAVADPGSIVANSSLLAKLTSKSATPAFSSYVSTTDSLEAIRDNATSGASVSDILAALTAYKRVVVYDPHPQVGSLLLNQGDGYTGTRKVQFTNSAGTWAGAAGTISGTIKLRLTRDATTLETAAATIHTATGSQRVDVPITEALTDQLDFVTWDYQLIMVPDTGDEETLEQGVATVALRLPAP